MRQKAMLSENDPQFRCCLCCHVRAGTTLLGTFYVLLNLLALTLTTITLVAACKPDLLKDDLQTRLTFTIDQNGSSSSSDYLPLDQINSNGCLVFVLFLITFLFSVMLLYGTIRSRPGYMLPFFCMLVFDFCIHCLSVVRYMTYTPNIKAWIIDQGLADTPPFKHMMEMDDQYLQLWFVLFFVLVLSMKAYIINMVWMCYKYLLLRNSIRQQGCQYSTDLDSEMLLPPKYEDAIKMESNNGPPPPPYSA